MLCPDFGQNLNTLKLDKSSSSGRSHTFLPITNLVARPVWNHRRGWSHIQSSSVHPMTLSNILSPKLNLISSLKTQPCPQPCIVLVSKSTDTESPTALLIRIWLADIEPYDTAMVASCAITTNQWCNLCISIAELGFGCQGNSMICKVMMHIQIGTPPLGSYSLDNLPSKIALCRAERGSQTQSGKAIQWWFASTYYWTASFTRTLVDSKNHQTVLTSTLFDKHGPFPS